MTSQRNGQSRERSTLRQPSTGVVFNILPRPRAVVLCVSSGLDRRAIYGWRSLWKGQAVFLSVSGRGRLLRCRARGCWGRWKQAPDVGHACGRRGRCSLLQSRGAADGGSGGYVQCPAAAHSTTSDWMPGPGPRLADQPRFLRTIVTNPRNKQSGNLGKVPGPGVLSLMVVFPESHDASLARVMVHSGPVDTLATDGIISSSTCCLSDLPLLAPPGRKRWPSFFNRAT